MPVASSLRTRPEPAPVRLFAAMIESAGRARRHLRAGDSAALARELNRCQAVLAELAGAVDPEAAPHAAGRLSELYQHLNARLRDARQHFSEEALNETTALLSILLAGCLSAARAA